MLSTDIMSRGIDIEDIDWVIHWFVHRAGRTARCGREGNALIVLTPQQIAYVGFVSKHEMVNEFLLDSLKNFLVSMAFIFAKKEKKSIKGKAKNARDTFDIEVET
uniref:ATP-dependent RNA helicase n=1 Tax=Heterorhabditis bacteriophora TaxID=37862 RepID=A0A1I7WJF2_HETBA